MYQIKAIALGVRRANMAFFLDPGMGKTSIALRILKNLQRMKRGRAALVVAPLRPCYTVWPKEVKKWTFAIGMKVRVLHGPNKLWELSQPADIYVINPEGLKWLFTVALKGKRNWPFDILFVDESGKFKNPASARLKLLKPRLPKFKHRYVMNGTPAPNGLEDLWGQFLIVDMGAKFGRTINDYRLQYFKRAGYKGKGYEIASDKHKDYIYRRAAHMCIVMEAKDYLDMPEIVFVERTVQLPPQARLHYQEVEKELFTAIADEGVEIKNSAVATGACRQITGGALYHPRKEGEAPVPQARRPFYRLHDVKTEGLIELIDELQGKPLLVAYDFHHELVRIREAVKKAFKYDIAHIGSGVTPKEGERIEAAWNKGQIRVLAGHPGSISHGLNLQEGPGADICWFTQTWDLEQYLQYIQRLWRQGHKGKCVRIHHLIAEGTIDEVMMERLGLKTQAQTDFKTAVKMYRDRIRPAVDEKSGQPRFGRR
jgi:SNF2 family DNA or RNA helicase